MQEPFPDSPSPPWLPYVLRCVFCRGFDAAVPTGLRPIEDDTESGEFGTHVERPVVVVCLDVPSYKRAHKV